MEILFNILLFVVGIGGYAWSIIVFLEYSEGKDSRVVSSLVAFWVSAPIFLFFSWLFSERMAFFRISYLYILNVLFISYSIFSALGAHYYEQKIEDLLNVSNRFMHHLVRLIIIAFSAFSLASSISVFKSVLYQLDYAKYEFSPTLQKSIAEEAQNQIFNFHSQKSNCSKFKLDVESIANENLEVKKENVFSFLSGSYYLALNEEHNFSVEYAYTRGSKEAMPVHNIKYISNENPDCECLINLGSTRRSRLTTVNKSTLLDRIGQQLIEFDKMVDQVAEKLVSISTFAWSNFMGLLKIDGYEIESVDENAKTIDKILYWTYAILVVIVFFEFNRKNRKRNNHSVN